MLVVVGLSSGRGGVIVFQRFMMFFSRGMLALVARRSWCDTSAWMFSREGELENMLKYVFVGIFRFMCEQIRVVQGFC